MLDALSVRRSVRRPCAAAQLRRCSPRARDWELGRTEPVSQGPGGRGRGGRGGRSGGGGPRVGGLVLPVLVVLVLVLVVMVVLVPLLVLVLLLLCCRLLLAAAVVGCGRGRPWPACRGLVRRAGGSGSGRAATAPLLRARCAAALRYGRRVRVRHRNGPRSLGASGLVARRSSLVVARSSAWSCSGCAAPPPPCPPRCSAAAVQRCAGAPRCSRRRPAQPSPAQPTQRHEHMASPSAKPQRRRRRPPGTTRAAPVGSCRRRRGQRVGVGWRARSRARSPSSPSHGQRLQRPRRPAERQQRPLGRAAADGRRPRPAGWCPCSERRRGMAGAADLGGRLAASSCPSSLGCPSQARRRAGSQARRLRLKAQAQAQAQAQVRPRLRLAVARRMSLPAARARRLAADEIRHRLSPSPSPPSAFRPLPSALCPPPLPSFATAGPASLAAALADDTARGPSDPCVVAVATVATVAVAVAVAAVAAVSSRSRPPAAGPIVAASSRPRPRPRPRPHRPRHTEYAAVPPRRTMRERQQQQQQRGRLAMRQSRRPSPPRRDATAPRRRPRRPPIWRRPRSMPATTLVAPRPLLARSSLPPRPSLLARDCKTAASRPARGQPAQEPSGEAGGHGLAGRPLACFWCDAWRVWGHPGRRAGVGSVGSESQLRTAGRPILPADPASRCTRPAARPSDQARRPGGQAGRAR